MRQRDANGTGTGRRWAARLAGVALVALTGLGIAPGVASAKPTNPSDGQLTAAQQAVADAAAQVGTLSAQLAAAQAQADAAQAAANIALDTYQGKQAEYEAAQQTADAADASAAQAQQQLDEARARLASFARDSYMSGSTSSRLTGLLSSGSPTQMIERAALLDAVGDDRSTVLDQVTVARQQAADAQTAAHTALTTADDLKQQASAALAAAERLESSARSQADAVQAQAAQTETQLQQAQQTLATLQGQRSAAVQYQQQQAAAAAAAAAAATSARPAAAATAARPAASSASSAGARSASGTDTAGPGSSSAVETAIAAAKRWIGTRYAWGGGSLTGPSLGFGIDAGVVGFDCSGLTRYAYAQARISIPRNSSGQYTELPKVSRANLQRGDLVFWATDTSRPSTIHHVAIYLGDGQILEAPESGKTVRITSMRWSGFIGGARPTA